jgi:hypothetical protein
VNEARFGYNSLYNNIGRQLAGIEDVDAEIGAPLKITGKNSWGIPNIDLTNNLSSYGMPPLAPSRSTTRRFSSWIISAGSSGSTHYAWARVSLLGQPERRAQIRSTAARMRQIQLALKYNF